MEPPVDVSSADEEMTPVAHGAVPATQIVKRERSVSPDNADERLEAMLRARGSEVEPAWVSRLQQNIGEQIEQAVGSLAQRIAVLENKPSDPRIDDMAAQIADLRRRLDQQPASSSNATAVAPPGSGQGLPNAIPLNQHQSSTQDMDFNHLLVGGWNRDTVKHIIDRDMLHFTAQWSPAHAVDITKTVIWSKRASTSHIYLRPLPVDEARERYYAIREAVNEKFACSTGVLMWITPSKSLARRMKNKSTRFAIEKINILCSARQDVLSTLDADWTRQIIWLHDARVASANAAALLAPPQARVVALTRKNEQGEDLQFHFNVTALSALVGIGLQDCEAALHTD